MGEGPPSPPALGGQCPFDGDNRPQGAGRRLKGPPQDRHQHPAAVDLVERPADGAQRGRVVQVVGAGARQELHVLATRGSAEGDEQGIGVEGARRGLHPPGPRVDRRHLRLHEADTPCGQAREPGASLLEGPDAGEVPELGEPHEEPVAAVHEGDVDAIAEAGSQGVHGGQATEPATEDHDVGHGRRP